MNRKEESEAEECNDDEVDETNTNSRCHICRAKGSKIEGCKAYSWGESLWCSYEICSWDRIVLHKRFGPACAELRRHLHLESS